jgi:hypothetical protein
MELKIFFLARAAQNLERWQQRAQFEQTATAWTGTVTTWFDLGDRQIDSEAVA